MAPTAGIGFSRRTFMRAGALGVGGLVAGQALAADDVGRAALGRDLFCRALTALDRHRGAVAKRDLIAIADFSAPSSVPRFHLVNTVSGRATSLLVAHGRGSDPAHTGWLSRFSNQDGSQASSSGAFLTGDTYYGKHGHSRRLIGLDPTNTNAEVRGIVVHSAWYVSPDLVRERGKIGRSEGCFAVAESDLDQVMSRLGAGRMIYADKV